MKFLSSLMSALTLLLIALIALGYLISETVHLRAEVLRLKEENQQIPALRSRIIELQQVVEEERALREQTEAALQETQSRLVVLEQSSTRETEPATPGDKGTGVSQNSKRVTVPSFSKLERWQQIALITVSSLIIAITTSGFYYQHSTTNGYDDSRKGRTVRQTTRTRSAQSDTPFVTVRMTRQQLRQYIRWQRRN